MAEHGAQEKLEPSFMDALIKAAPDEKTFRKWMRDVQEFAGDFESGAAARLGEVPDYLKGVKERATEVGTGLTDSFDNAQLQAKLGVSKGLGGLSELAGGGGVSDLLSGAQDLVKPESAVPPEILSPEQAQQLGLPPGTSASELIQLLFEKLQNAGANAQTGQLAPQQPRVIR